MSTLIPVVKLNWSKKLVMEGAFAVLLGALISGAAWAQGPETGRPDKESKDDPRARAEYLEKKRGGPAPAGARMRALEQMDRMIREEGIRFRELTNQSAAQPIESFIAANPTTWTPIGPQPTTTGFSASFWPRSSGRVSAIAVDPTNANIVYAGAAQGGVWKTTDGGATWSPMSDQEQSLAIGSLAIDPLNSQVIYAGTGEQNFSGDSYYGAGILKSINGGSTWTRLTNAAFDGTNGRGLGGTPSVGALAIRPGTTGATQEILAAVRGTPSGVYRSVDGGTSWSLVQSGNSTTAVAFASSTVAYAGIRQSGVFKSTNGGATFAPSNGTGANIINTTGSGRVAIGVSPSNPNIVYASVNEEATGNLLGFYKTTDGGTNWTKLGPIANSSGAPAPVGSLVDFCTPQCWYDMVIAVHPTNANVVFAGGSAAQAFFAGGASAVDAHLLMSANGGTSWTPVTTAIHVDHHAAAFSATGAKLYWGDDGGAYSTTNTSATPVTWTNLDSGLNTTQFYGHFALHPTNINVTYGGAQDNGVQVYDGTQLINSAWKYATCGDGAGAVIDFNTPATVYANCQFVDVRKSPTGAPFSFVGSDLDITDTNVEFIPPLVGDPMGAPFADSNRLYFGTTRVWQTNNGAANWFPVSGDLSASRVIEDIEAAPGNANVVYAVTDDGRVARATNAAGVSGGSLADFTDVTGTGLPAGLLITAIGISPTDANTAYVTVTGFGSGHVFKTTAGGGTWANISGNLPDTPANDIVVDPDLANTLYVATDVGVFRTTDSGATWTTLASGLPRVAVLGLKLHRASRTLRAATHGRGMWDLAVPLSGAGAQFSPNGLVFGEQVAGTTSAAQTLTLTNNGAATLTISSITASAEFARSGGACASSLAAGASCTIGVTFTPSGINQRTGTLTVNGNSGNNPAKATLFGTGIPSGPGAALSPTSLFFAGQPMFTTSAPQTITLTNNGTLATNIGSITTTAEFSQTNNCPASLAVNASCAINVSFIPAATGTRNGALTVSSDALSSPTTAALSGLGNPAVPPNDNFANGMVILSTPFTHSVDSTSATIETNDPFPPSPTCVPSGSPDTRSHSVWYFYTPGANGTVSVNTSGSNYDTILSVWTGMPGSFSSVGCNDDVITGSVVTSDLSFSAVAGTTYRIMASGFPPSDFGNLSFSLTGPAPVPIGPVSLAVSPATVFFATSMVSSTSAAQTITVTAQNGTVSGIAVSAATGDFQRTATCGSTLAAGASCTISVTFTPTAIGTRTGSITVTSTGAGSPQTVNLNGIGRDFSLSFVRPSRTTRTQVQGSVAAGQTAGFDLLLNSSGGNETVTFECLGAPRGAVCSVEPATISLSQPSTPIRALVTTTAGSRRARRLGGAAGTPPGIYDITVNARVGNAVRSVVMKLTVVR